MGKMSKIVMEVSIFEREDSRGFNIVRTNSASGKTEAGILHSSEAENVERFLERTK